MSDVKRYDLEADASLDYAAMVEFSTGEYVTYDDYAALRAELERVRGMLATLEWSGRARGPGSGYMASGGDGELVPSCPICRGIQPGDAANRNFTKEAHGHREGCALRALAGGEGR